MRLPLAILLASLPPAALAAVLVGCSGPKMPSGPPPEYEDPPRPSWLSDGGPPGANAPPAAPASDAGNT